MTHSNNNTSMLNCEIKLSSLDEKILQPYIYLRQMTKHKLLDNYMRAFNYWLQIPEDKLKVIKDVVDLIYEVTLLFDDIEDDSNCRRGKPTAHVVYGLASTINAGCFVLILAMEKILSLNHHEAANMFVEQVKEIQRGQGLDVSWRDNFICPTEEEYIAMAKQKAGGSLFIKIMQLFSENQFDLTNVAELFSLFFQIRNDYYNLKGVKYAEYKTYCEDLTEGKFSFPIIHAIRTQPNDSQVIDILRMRTRENEVKQHCISLMEKYGSFKYTRGILMRLGKEIREEIKSLGGNPLFDEMLDQLLAWETP